MQSNCGSNWVKWTYTVLPAIIFVLFPAPPVFAQTQDAHQPDFQQVQKRIEQLEQEIRDLKQQVAAAAPTTASDYKSNGQAPAATPAEKSKSDSTVDIYGFAMLDSGYQFHTIDPNWFDVVRPVKLPAFSGEFAPNGKAFYGVRQTRFGVKSLTPTSFGDLKTLFEFELFGTGVDAGQTTFRLRHAYGELGHVWRRPILECVHGHRCLPQLARILGTEWHDLLPQRTGSLDTDPRR